VAIPKVNPTSVNPKLAKKAKKILKQGPSAGKLVAGAKKKPGLVKVARRKGY